MLITVEEFQIKQCIEQHNLIELMEQQVALEKRNYLKMVQMTTENQIPKEYKGIKILEKDNLIEVIL